MLNVSLICDKIQHFSLIAPSRPVVRLITTRWLNSWFDVLPVVFAPDSFQMFRPNCPERLMSVTCVTALTLPTWFCHYLGLWVTPFHTCPNATLKSNEAAQYKVPYLLSVWRLLPPIPPVLASYYLEGSGKINQWLMGCCDFARSRLHFHVISQLGWNFCHIN